MTERILNINFARMHAFVYTLNKFGSRDVICTFECQHIHLNCWCPERESAEVTVYFEGFGRLFHGYSPTCGSLNLDFVDKIEIEFGCGVFC